jgi:CheY-like chemotaxis protein
MNSAPVIFIVDDDPVFQTLLNIGISHIDLPKEVKLFNNGKEALKYLDDAPENDVLVFLDLNMPIMNGWEFLEELQSKDYQKRVLIVITSTSTLANDKTRAFQYQQVLFYKEKPLNVALVKSLVEDIFEVYYVGR